jgi:protein TonB
MKKITLLLFITLISQLGMAQESTAIPKEDNTVYNAAALEVLPEFPGGNAEFGLYVQRNYKYPTNVKFLHGRIFVNFVIEKDGSIVDIDVVRDLGFGTKEEAIRMLKNCPKWTPGTIGGKPIRVRYSLPIQIDIN